MGHWGTQPWENDSAADWLDEVAGQGQLLDRIREALTLPLEQIDEIRAAAHFLLHLTKAGIGVRSDMNLLARGAVFRLSEAVEERLFSHPDFSTNMISEIARLRELFSSAEDDQLPPLIERSKVKQIASEQFGLTLYDVADVEGTIPETKTHDVVGTGFLDECGVLHLQLTDGRGHFEVSFRCVPDDPQ